MSNFAWVHVSYRADGKNRGSGTEAMKKLPWLLVVLLAIACIVAWFRPHESLPAEMRTETKIQTVVRT